ILAGQATVAVRNALLYNQVPLLNVGGRLRSLWSGGEGARTGRALLWAGAAAAVLAVLLIPWDYRAVGKFRFRPASRVEVTAQTAGSIRRILVREGDTVPTGAVLAILEDREVEQAWT